MKTFLVPFVTSLAVLVALDATWIYLFMSKLFNAEMPHLMRPSIWVTPAILFYLVYCAGLVLLVIQRPDVGGDLLRSALYSALMGFLAYSTYDLTNLATLQGWTLTVTVVDILWGTFVTMLAGLAGAYALQWCRAE
jgi:uncharacterized membrane protein